MTDQPGRHRLPADAAERITAARERGASFEAIARDFGVSFATVRNKAIGLGVHTVVPRRRFTPEEDAIIRADYLAHVDIAITAAKLGRSWGAVRQRIFHYMKTCSSRAGHRGAGGCCGNTARRCSITALLRTRRRARSRNW